MNNLLTGPCKKPGTWHLAPMCHQVCKMTSDKFARHNEDHLAVQLRPTHSEAVNLEADKAFKDI